MKNMKYKIIFVIALVCVNLFTSVPNILAQGTRGNPIPLTLGVWKDGEITDDIKEIWYTINVTNTGISGIYIYWKDNFDLQDTYTLLNAQVYIYKEDGTLINSPDTPILSPPNSFGDYREYHTSGLPKGKIFIKVVPQISDFTKNFYQYGTNGTFSIGAFKPY